MKLNYEAVRKNILLRDEIIQFIPLKNKQYVFTLVLVHVRLWPMLEQGS